MSDKIEMTITINELVSPLLFERLSSCSSARRRAAVLKALAESALRKELIDQVASARPAVAAAAVASAMPRLDGPIRTAGKVDSDEFRVLSVGDGSEDRPAFDDGLSDQLGAWT
ncbi:hypothetical protein [Burkholderia gladioli]|uniref:hypothetical protein n=1 Tax=Burkholderia gladioli TaxID=28095 RepID=UPI002FE3E283